MKKFNFDPEGQEHQIFVRNDMVYEKNRSYDPDGDEGSGDTIGRTMRAMRVYIYFPFFEAIRKCWTLQQARGGKQFLFGWRSNVDKYRMDMSRDHLIHTVMAEFWKGSQFTVARFYALVPWRFSFGFKKTVDIHLWAKTLGGTKWSRHLYYWWQIPQSLVIGVWSKIAKLLLRIGPEYSLPDYMWNKDAIKAKHERIKKWLWLIPPVYAMYGRIEMLECMPRSIGKRLLSRILLWNVPRHNYVMKLMLGAYVSQEEVESYRAVKGGRWSTSLDARCKRDIQYRDPYEPNLLDKDWLTYHYHKPVVSH